MIMRMIVLLPAPLGPSSPNLARLRTERDPVHGEVVAVALHDLVNLDHAFGTLR